MSGKSEPMLGVTSPARPAAASKNPPSLAARRFLDRAGLASKSVYVFYAGRSVGTLAATRDGVLAFEYEDEWLRDGFSISPLSLPLEKRVFVADRHPLDGVFGVFDDSLPDGWGRLLVDRLLRSQGIDPYEVGPIARLSLVGSSGMGALEYEPATDVPLAGSALDLDELAEECARLLRTDFSEDLDALFALGGSSGGARPKILTRIDGEEWIVKFPASVDGPAIGLEEYRIALAAQACGIAMPEVRLFPSKRCEGYFGVRRFDRVRDAHGRTTKVHMASAGALLETSHRIPNLDYDMLMKLTLKLTDDFSEVERLYRLMCFNVFVGNRDDHAKNFSYLYDEPRGAWTLSPAYDLTRNDGMNGEHATTVNGKGRNIELEDLLAVGARAGLTPSCARVIADEARDAVVDMEAERGLS